MRIKLAPLLIFLSLALGITGAAFYFTGSSLAAAFAPGSPGAYGAWAWATGARPAAQSAQAATNNEMRRGWSRPGD